MNSLAPWVTYKPICPEVAIGLPVPRLRCVLSRRPVATFGCAIAMPRTMTLPERMNAFADRFLPTIGELAGFIVCAKIAQLRNGARSPV
ncbi:pathogenicity island protein [Salmonella enterica subsp. enterica]|uniref:Pathogenicity island protein n=1 Tax=Salmonella enterica I TaxID=59201 RepID=A0A379VRR7_SALET|nr:pathogenicity island protein [Salmonella enterica subsp. enterica]